MAQVICLYSKHSQECQKFVKLAAQHPFIQPVCVDNAKLRKKIMSSQALAITKVPTVIVVREDGMVEKYDDTAYQWLEEISGSQSGSNSKDSPQDTTPLNIPAPQPSQAVEQQPVQQPVEHQPVQQPPPVQQQIPQQPVPQQMPQQMAEGVTPLPGMDSAVAGLPQMGGTPIEDISGGFPQPIEHQAMPPQQDPVSGGGGGGIMAAAEQMQRERNRESGKSAQHR